MSGLPRPLRNALVSMVLLSIPASLAHGATAAPPGSPPAAFLPLYPEANEFREVLDLSGLWDFRLDPKDEGERASWFSGLPSPREVAVPGSWNEQIDGAFDYLGPAWYFKSAQVPRGWKGDLVFLRIGSANYGARVWVNGVFVGAHEGGHLPFAFDVTRLAVPGRPLTIAIRVENELKPTRVPAGNLPPGQGLFGLFTGNPRTTFDFFPYAGLHRAVQLYSVPPAHVEDVAVRTSFEGATGVVRVKVTQRDAGAREGRVRIDGLGLEAPLRFTGREAEVALRIPQVRAWSTDDPHLYPLSVSLLGPSRAEVDRYTLDIGVRTIEVRGSELLLNGKRVFLKGFGRHEDFAVSGRGLNLPVMVRDNALLKWTGANSYRTSHYPYSEEEMRLADREGFLVIDEIPAVSLHFGDGEENVRARLEQCKRQVRDLVTRDKNHPSVVIWSVSNEAAPPNLNLSGGSAPADPVATDFLSSLIALAHELDPTRPATLVAVMGAPMEWIALGDVVCLNRYWGWYVQPADLTAGRAMLDRELEAVHARVPKPVILTEFGADTLPGNHSVDDLMWSEEFQVEFLKTYLDVAATKDYVVGLHVWNLADFRTSQGVLRPGTMNHKGVFTRDRSPKMAAHFLRERWFGKSGQAESEASSPPK